MYPGEVLGGIHNALAALLAKAFAQKTSSGMKQGKPEQPQAPTDKRGTPLGDDGGHLPDFDPLWPVAKRRAVVAELPD